MDTQTELSVLMQQIRDGSQEAARELWERYGPHILRVVRRKLDKKLRSKFDSADFEQAVWASFFVNPTHAYRFERPEELIAFLENLARNKLVDTLRQRYRTKKYNINRERSLDGSAAYAVINAADHQPTPSQRAIADERWTQLLEGQPLRYRRILVLLREGHTHQEIARQLGISEKTVRRLVQKLDLDGSAS